MIDNWQHSCVLCSFLHFFHASLHTIINSSVCDLFKNDNLTDQLLSFDIQQILLHLKRLNHEKKKSFFYFISVE